MKSRVTWILFSILVLSTISNVKSQDEIINQAVSSEESATGSPQDEQKLDAQNMIDVSDDNNQSTLSKDENGDGIISTEGNLEGFAVSSNAVEDQQANTEASSEQQTTQSVELNDKSSAAANNEDIFEDKTEKETKDHLASMANEVVTQQKDGESDTTLSNLFIIEATSNELDTNNTVANNTVDSVPYKNKDLLQQEELVTNVPVNDLTTKVEAISTNDDSTDFSRILSDNGSGSGDVQETVDIFQTTIESETTAEPQNSSDSETSFYNQTSVPQVFICEEYEFNCDFNKCLNNSKMCDSLLDCEDGVDESSCDKQNNVSTSIPIDLITASPIPAVVVALFPNEEVLEIREGSSLTIKCTVSGLLSDLQIVIYKDQVPVGQSDSGLVEVLITNAKFSDEGDYLCYGYPTDRSVYDVKAIKVTVASDRPRPGYRPNKSDRKLIHTADLDSKIDLSCEFSTNQEVKWRKVEGDLSDYAREHLGKLYVYYLKYSDSGEYECYLPDGRASRVKLYVRDPSSPVQPEPELDPAESYYSIRAYIDKSKLELKYGENDEQTCTGMTNADRLDIEWYNPRGQLITNNGNFIINAVSSEMSNGVFTKVSKLKIFNFNQVNSGIYECRALVDKQKTSAKFEITIQTADGGLKPPTQSQVCDIQEATCRTGQCIPRNAVCNGVRDCPDGSDENSCSGLSPSNKCEPNEKKCRNGKCIQKIWFCDGENDCGDNSDEDQCPFYKAQLKPGEKCHANEFLCRNGQQCVLKGFVCDSEKDCLDNSDEIGCEQPRIIRGPTRNLTVVLGGTLKIECAADGFPEPFINWRLNWGHVCEEPRCYSTSVKGRGTLTITNARASDAGAYSCEALNSKGRLFAIPDGILSVYDSGRVPEPEYGQCNMYGSLNRLPPCRCKPSVTGRFCDECEDGFFNLVMNKLDYKNGCMSCFCNGLDVNCRSSDLYYNTIDSKFQGDSEDWTIVDDKKSFKTNLNVQRGYIEFNQFDEFQNQELFFAAPRKYKGNRLNSYGGNLTFKIRFEGSTASERPRKLIIRLSGNGVNLVYNHPGSFFSAYRDHKISVNLNEENFKKFGDETSINRDQFLMVLSNVEHLMIRASFLKQQYSTRLSDVSLSSAEAYPVGESQKALAVEVCQCPIGYAGSSCESCAPGYKKVNGLYLGLCEKDTYPQVTLTIDVPENKLVLRPGQSHVIHVSVSGGGTAVWFREPQNALPPGVEQIGNNLIIKNARPEISGNYVCVLYTATGQVKEVVFINVRPDGNDLRQPPSIFSPNERINKVRLGSSFTLECTARGNPLPSIRIETPNSQNIRKEISDIRDQQFNPSVRYEISYFTQDNIGEYKCIAQNEYGETTVERFLVTSDRGSIEPPSIRIEPKDLEVIEGSDILVNFTYSGAEPVDVMVELFSPQRNPLSNLIVNKEARKISIKGVTKDMDGQYLITVSNLYGTQKDYFYLRVVDAPGPKIFISETVLRTDENTALKIEPRVQYSGRPSFRWTKDDGPIPSNVQTNGYIIYIPQVKKENEGVYTLTLDDRSGSAKIQVRVFVEQRTPAITTRRPGGIRRISIREDTTIELDLGETANLLCSLKPKTVSSKVITATSWFKGSRSQKEKFPTNIRPNQEQLQVIKFKPSNVGSYTCTQSSSDGTFQSIVVNLVLKEQNTPRITAKIAENNKQINVGDNLDINCLTSGNPEPVVSWIFNGQIIDDTDNLFPRGNILYIRGAQLEQNGYFTCRATGSDGKYVEDKALVTVVPVVPAEKQLAAEITPKAASANTGETSRFTCRLVDQSTNLESETNTRFEWSKQNDQLPSGSQQNENGDIILYDLQEKDSGIYQCSIEDLNTGKIHQAFASLGVVKPDQPLNNDQDPFNLVPLSVDVTPDVANLIQGSDTVFTCSVLGGKNPKVSWKKISDNLNPNRHIINGNNLEVKNVQPEDRGYFECQADDETDSARDYVRVDIEEREAPKIEIYPMEREIPLEIGSVAYAQCRISAGIPNPTIEWRRSDGRAMSPKVTLTQEGSLLQIQDASKEEMGSYECIAKNVAGIASDEISFVLSSTSQPTNSNANEDNENDLAEAERKRQEEEERRKTEERNKQNQTPPDVVVPSPVVQAQEGQTATLTCYTTNNLPHRIEWLNPTGNYIQTQEGGSLVLNNVKPGDSGLYTCEIINSYGRNKANVELNVASNNDRGEPIVVNIVPKSKSVAPGGSAEFKCNVNPDNNDPHIRWTRPGNTDLPQMSSQVGNVLYIKNIRVEDAGRYQCTVTTSDDKVAFDAAYLQVTRKESDSAFPVYIKVLEKPTDLTSNPGYRYGVKLTVECVAQSQNIVDVTWNKLEGGVNRATYDKSDNKNTMTMEALVTMDLGSYVCIATRRDGTRAQNIIAFVRHPDHANQFEYKIEGLSEPVEEQDIDQSVDTDPKQPEADRDEDKTTDKDATSPPIVKIQGADQIRKFEGESFELICDVSGNPTPSLSWTKYGEEILPSKHVEKNNVLKLNNLDVTDSGYYLCTAENSVGRERAYIILQVESRQPNENPTDSIQENREREDKERKEQEERKRKEQEEKERKEQEKEQEISDENKQPPIVFIKSRSVINVSPGIEFILSCYVSKSSIDSQVEFRKVDSSQLNEHVHLTAHTAKESDNFNRYDLTFTPFKEADIGQYKCTGSNKNGQTHDIAYIESQEDESYSFRTENFNAKNNSDNVKISVIGEIVNNNIVELSCSLQSNNKAKYYQWARYENFPQSAVRDKNKLFINSFSNEDNGIYGCKVVEEENNQELFGLRLIASNDYLLEKNPYFSFTRENPDYITVRCRPDFNTQIKWKVSEQTGEPKANFEIDGDELHLYKTDRTNHYSCQVPSDNEYGSIVLDLEVNRDLLDRAFEKEIPKELTEPDVEENINNLPCTPGENC